KFLPWARPGGQWRWTVTDRRPSRRGDGHGATVHAKDTRDSAVALGARAHAPRGGQERRRERRRGPPRGVARQEGRAGLAGRRGPERQRARGEAVRRILRWPEPALARLRVHPRRAQEEG